MTDFLLDLHIEGPGATYHGTKGETLFSFVGHLWWEIIAPDGSRLQSGLAQYDQRGWGSVYRTGDVVDSDGLGYVGKSRAMARYRITPDQARLLESYHYDPRAFGFTKDNCRVTVSGCSEYFWKGLGLIGMHPSGTPAQRPRSGNGNSQSCEKLVDS